MPSYCLEEPRVRDLCYNHTMYEHNQLLSSKEKLSIEVEPARVEDAAEIAAVQRHTWLATYPNPEAGITKEDVWMAIAGKEGECIPVRVDRWREKLENVGSERGVFVVRDGDKVIGYTAPAIRDEQRRLGGLYVLPEAQSRGVGQALLEQAVAWHGRDEDIFLHAVSYNTSAIQFYTRHGFEATGREVMDDMAGKPLPCIEMVLHAASAIDSTVALK